VTRTIRSDDLLLARLVLPVPLGAAECLANPGQGDLVVAASPAKVSAIRTWRRSLPCVRPGDAMACGLVGRVDDCISTPCQGSRVPSARRPETPPRDDHMSR